MLRFDTTIDTKAAQEFLGAAAAQLPKRTGFAMNTTANEIQHLIQGSLEGPFRLRRSAFVKRTIYRKPGEDFPDIKGGRLVAAVRVNPDQDFLAKFEEGGVKTPRGQKLAVPIIRKERPSLVITRGSKYHLGTLGSGLFGKGAKGGRFYGVVSRKGTPLILERLSRNRTRVVYAMVDRVPIPRRLNFYGIAGRVFAREWPLNMQRELDEAVRRAEQKRTD